MRLNDRLKVHKTYKENTNKISNIIKEAKQREAKILHIVQQEHSVMNSTYII